MKITINVEAQFLAAISEALAKYKSDGAVTDSDVAAFIEMDLNARYESIHENEGFENEIDMMSDEMEYFFE